MHALWSSGETAVRRAEIGRSLEAAYDRLAELYGIITNGEPTLRLDMESVVVLDIKGVQYDRHRREVSRHRSTKGEERGF